MKNKVIIGLSVVVCILLISTVVLGVKLNDTKKADKTKSNITTPKVEEDVSAVEIKFSGEITNKEKAYALVTKYLEQYKKGSLGSQQILDYKVGVIKVRAAKDLGFECSFDFSVKPKDANAWLVGSAKQEGEWISKDMFVEVKKSGDLYTFNIPATSPNAENSSEFK
ncbi:hypothetical protein [Inconstantimicrobium mannanitabidum]|uniref:Uncharacterized protein n=1 Tax=Inconstantimicrobium mannanitabidum TaxID=1604901 RepID=A0ACB5RHQ5_9CLOT|nr:hypothetical protein [Clostridium sp. TW13]GKX68613.1 hypothetical protein rsdtw13_38710 [Clostridium sp. TW13]